MVTNASLLRQFYRRIRLKIKSILFLPYFVRIVTNNKEAKLSTRNFPTANVALWLNTKDILNYEEESRNMIESLFKNCKTFWDIGAQIGFYSIVAALNNVENIVAVDIDSIYCNEIKKHAKQNNLKIDVLNIATGISGKTISFENYGKTTVKEAISLDELFEMTKNAPDVIKIDIDGGEIDTLKGAKKLLISYSPKIVIEILDEYRDEIVKTLTDYGYSLKDTKGIINTLWTK